MRIQLNYGLPIVSPIQLGSIQEPYGFDGILGIDFMMRAKYHVDFETMQIYYSR
ncbi:hypothetical protein D3C80_2234170 [compost metagenome]